MKKKLIKALSFLPDGQGIELGEDTFLTGMLDGSDKIYGFGRNGDEYVVIQGSTTTYPIMDMDKEDLDYIFKFSTPNIYKKIKTASYRIEDIENI